MPLYLRPEPPPPIPPRGTLPVSLFPRAVTYGRVPSRPEPLNSGDKNLTPILLVGIVGTLIFVVGSALTVLMTSLVWGKAHAIWFLVGLSASYLGLSLAFIRGLWRRLHTGRDTGVALRRTRNAGRNFLTQRKPSGSTRAISTGGLDGLPERSTGMRDTLPIGYY